MKSSGNANISVQIPVQNIQNMTSLETSPIDNQGLLSYKKKIILCEVLLIFVGVRYAMIFIIIVLVFFFWALMCWLKCFVLFSFFFLFLVETICRLRKQLPPFKLQFNQLPHPLNLYPFNKVLLFSKVSFLFLILTKSLIFLE